MKTGIRIVALVAGLAAVAAAASPWVKPPTRDDRDHTPGLEHLTLRSEFMQAEVGFNVVLPEGYADDEAKRFPVVYWLHGGGGNESSTLFTAKVWRELAADGTIGPVILVYPNGRRSGYMDHHDGKIRVESMIIRELIPKVDREFRTIAKREGRAVHGFSMGSAGALRFVTKYPGLFCSAAAYGGGAVDLAKSEDPFIRKIVERNLANDPELVRRHNTYHFLKRNAEVLRKKGTRIRLVCGQEDRWMQSALRFHAELKLKDIDCTTVTVPGVGHHLGLVYRAEGATTAKWQDETFKAALRKLPSS